MNECQPLSSLLDSGREQGWELSLGLLPQGEGQIVGQTKMMEVSYGWGGPSWLYRCCPPRTEHAHNLHEAACVVLDPSCHMEVSIGRVGGIYGLAVVVFRGVPFQVRALNFYPVLFVIPTSLLGAGELGSWTSFLRQCSRWPQMLEEPRELSAGTLGSCGRLGCRASSRHLSLQSSSFDRAQLLPNAERNCPPLPGWNLSRIMPRHDYLEEQKW